MKMISLWKQARAYVGAPIGDGFEWEEQAALRFAALIQAEERGWISPQTVKEQRWERIQRDAEATARLNLLTALVAATGLDKYIASAIEAHETRDHDE